MSQHDEIMRAIGNMEGKIDLILSEAKRTNGRVTKLEESMSTLRVSDAIQNTKFGIIGAVAGAVASFLMGMLR